MCKDIKNSNMLTLTRGGKKFLYAIEIWPMNFNGCICLDVGCSTGGVSSVLVSKGVCQVYAVDCGKNQIMYSLRVNRHIKLFEGRSIQSIPKGSFLKALSIIIVDVSFTRISAVFLSILLHVRHYSFFYILVKPQYECKRQDLGLYGILKSNERRTIVLFDVLKYIEALNVKILGITISPLLERMKNVEYLIYAFKC